MTSLDLATLDHVASPIFVIDVKPGMRFEFRAVNAAHTSMSGLTNADVFGKTAIELFEGRAGHNAWHRHAMVVESGRPLTYVITLPIKSDERAYRTTLKPIFGPENNVVSILGTMVEITQQRQLEESTLLAEAASVDRMADAEQFVSMAAHDLRAPMRNVSQIAQMLREDLADQGLENPELIDMLENVGVKASKLISDVLTYSKAMTACTQSARFYLNGLCSDIFAILDPDGQHALSCDEAMLDADDIALQIVLRNLIDNALKHGARDRISLFIGLEGEENGMLRFSVRDNGSGLEDPKRAFLDSGKFTSDSGFGLLGIRRLLLSRGGTIWADAPPHDVGTLIRFTLPGRIISLSGDEAMDESEIALAPQAQKGLEDRKAASF